MTGNWVVLETSGRVGKVGLARGGEVVRAISLDDRRSHARDLAPAVSTLLETESLRPVDLAGVVVGLGPGSYTGLRVGLMSAKALVYVLGCELRAVETFAAIAEQAPAEAVIVWVIADALQGQIYLQHFARAPDSGVWTPASQLLIDRAEDQLNWAAPGTWMTGPGVRMYAEYIPHTCSVVPEAEWEPRVASVFAVGMRSPSRSRAELFALEPLYLRGSSAEEKRASIKQSGQTGDGAGS